MTDNLIEAQYVVSKKSKFKQFYQKNKILIYSLAGFGLILFGLVFFYMEQKEKKHILLSDNYIEAKINIKNGKNIEAKEILTNIIYENNSTYSAMSLFLILNNNLINDEREIVKLFDQLLENNKFDNEIRDLILFKKLLYKSDKSTEAELLNLSKPLLNSESLWKPHALLLMGDYFTFNKEYQKAKEFYERVLSINNLRQELYGQAQNQLIAINSK